MLSAFIYGTFQSRYDNEYQAIATEQQLLSQQIAAASLEAVSGSNEAARRLRAYQQLYDSTFKRYQEGNPATGLPPAPAELQEGIRQSEAAWQAARDAVDAIITGAPIVAEATSFVNQVQPASARTYGSC